MLSAYLALADQALERAAVALRLSPRDPLAFRVYIAMALANIVKGDYEAMLESSDRGVALNPRSLNFHYHRAIALTKLGRPEEAAAARGDREGVARALSDRWLADTTLFGTPARVREGIEAWHEAGVRTVIVVPSSASGNQMRAFEELFAAFS